MDEQNSIGQMEIVIACGALKIRLTDSIMRASTKKPTTQFSQSWPIKLAWTFRRKLLPRVQINDHSL